MKPFFKKLLLFVSLADAAFCFSQTNRIDTVHNLPEAEVVAGRLADFSSGNKIQEIDTNVLAVNNINTLADLLTHQSQVFIKSYGMGGLASSSFRGSGASHTTVLWNGFNLTSPMYGQLDLALVPVNFMNTVKLQYGGSGALWGSGAIGGTIHLNNAAEFDKGFSVAATYSYGNFEDKQQNIEVTVSRKKFISVTKLFNHDAKNDFPFVNVAQFGMPEQKMSNTELKQYGILQENYFKIREDQKLNFRLWYQFNDRNIPASMTVGAGKANQKDEFYRYVLEWQLTKEKFFVFVRSAYFDEFLDYTDPLISLESNSHSRSFITEAESKIRIASGQSINMGVNNTYSEAVSKKHIKEVVTSDYIKSPFQNRTSFFGSYKINNKKSTWIGTATLRQEFVSNGQSPLAASLGLEGWMFKKLRSRVSASKNYRLPTFNDLYWTPGGNPNLVSEKGISQELGLAFIHRANTFSLEAEATAFSNNVDNWIIWLPDKYGIWSPENVLSVWARGLEYDLKLSCIINKVKLNLGAHYHFVLSTNERIKSGSEASLNKQLIYVPPQKAIINTGVEYKGFRLSFSYNYIGYRYTTSDNAQYLKPYHLGNADISKTFIVSGMSLKAFVQINNIWNESYQVVAYYAMPRRYGQAGITVSFNHPNKKYN